MANTKRFNTKKEVFFYLLPFAIGLIIFTIYPIINVVLMAFKQSFRLSGVYKGIGLKNFLDLFNSDLLTGQNFLNGLRNTFIYVFTVVPICTVIAIVIANLLYKKLKGMAIFQTAFFLPLVTSSIAVGTVWKYMFNSQYGIVNYLLSLVGIEPINFLGATAGNASLNIVVVIIYGIWNMLPMTIILLLSGLSNIDPIYQTAAKIDGAKNFTIFRKITVPLLLPTIFLTLVINSISAFKVYNEIIPFWNGNPGATNRNMYTIVYYIKETFYNELQLGRAAAAAIVLFVIIFIFTMIQLYIQKKWKY